MYVGTFGHSLERSGPSDTFMLIFEVIGLYISGSAGVSPAASAVRRVETLDSLNLRRFARAALAAGETRSQLFSTIRSDGKADKLQEVRGATSEPKFEWHQT